MFDFLKYLYCDIMLTCVICIIYSSKRTERSTKKWFGTKNISFAFLVEHFNKINIIINLLFQTIVNMDIKKYIKHIL